MYRPEGWENPYSLKVSIPDTAIFSHNAENPAYKHFEAGADAMLEGLKKEGYFGIVTSGVDEGPWLVTKDNEYVDVEYFAEEGKKGTLVFIPEEE